MLSQASLPLASPLILSGYTGKLGCATGSGVPLHGGASRLTLIHGLNLRLLGPPPMLLYQWTHNYVCPD